LSGGPRKWDLDEKEIAGLTWEQLANYCSNKLRQVELAYDRLARESKEQYEKLEQESKEQYEKLEQESKEQYEKLEQESKEQYETLALKYDKLVESWEAQLKLEEEQKSKH
jgi:hypothetical protein